MPIISYTFIHEKIDSICIGCLPLLGQCSTHISHCCQGVRRIKILCKRSVKRYNFACNYTQEKLKMREREREIERELKKKVVNNTWKQNMATSNTLHKHFSVNKMFKIFCVLIGCHERQIRSGLKFNLWNIVSTFKKAR